MTPLLNLRLSAGYKREILRGVSLSIAPGELVGLAGGSGGGKSTIILAILGLLGFKGGYCRGEVIFNGRDILGLDNAAMRRIRGKEIALVPQNPLSSLNPHVSLHRQLVEAWRAHAQGQPPWERLLDSVSLPSSEEFLRQYPRQLSTGMAQRFLIALAVMHKPPLLLADEPTSALDTIAQSEILELFRRLNREDGIAMLYVSHDLASIGSLCRTVAILHDGEVVESGSAEDLFSNPVHPYTRRLIAAIPRTRREVPHAPAQHLR